VPLRIKQLHNLLTYAAAENPSAFGADTYPKNTLSGRSVFYVNTCSMIIAENRRKVKQNASRMARRVKSSGQIGVFFVRCDCIAIVSLFIEDFEYAVG
jgi:hypothetical protein